MSKSDLAQRREKPETKLPVVAASASEIKGFDGNLKKLLRHWELEETIQAMNTGITPDIVLTEPQGAMAFLGELTGRSIREDVTNRISHPPEKPGCCKSLRTAYRPGRLFI